MRWWTLTLCVFACATTASAAEPAGLPADVVTAWKDAGAQVGWIGRLADSKSADDPLKFSPDPAKLHADGRVPGFAVGGQGCKVDLAKLPAPEQDFGLSLYHCDFDEAELKELARFKKLVAFRVVGVGDRVTDGTLRGLGHVGLLYALPNAEGAGGKRPRRSADVVRLDLAECEVTDAGLKEVVVFENITHLSLFGTKVTDAGLKTLAGFEKLAELNLWFTPVTDAGLKELAPLKHLTRLDFTGTKVTGVGLKELTGSKDLVAVILNHCPVSDPGLKALAGFEKLSELELSLTRVTDAGLKELVPLKNLTRLDLSLTRVTDAGLKDVGKLTTLTRLSLNQTAVSDAGLSELAPLKRLTTLDVRHSKVTGPGLKDLKDLKGLTTLEAPRTDDVVKALREAGLLHIFSAAIGEKGARPRSADDVITFSLSEAPIQKSPATDAALKELAGFKNLTSLILWATGVTDAGLKELAGFEKLTELDLNGTKVTDAGLKELAGLKRLKKVSLFGTKVTDAGAADLKKALPACEIAR